MKKEKRDKIINTICRTFDDIEPAGTNSLYFRAKCDKMTDKQFDAYVRSVIYNEDLSSFYMHIVPFETDITMENIIKASERIGNKLFDKVGYYDVYVDDDNQTQAYYTTLEIFIGVCPIRKLKQQLSKKNNIPKNINKINPKTNQVTGESKGGRVSDMELYGLSVQNMPSLIKEMYGPRAGDPVMKRQMYQDIASDGHVSLDNLTNERKNKTAVNTANMLLLGAGLETDLVTKFGYMTQRTIDQDKIKGIKRKSDK